MQNDLNQTNLNIEDLQFSINQIIKALSGLAFLMQDARTQDALTNEEIGAILKLLAQGLKN